MPVCCIVKCGAIKNENQPQLSLHRFPKNEGLKKKWLEAIGEENINPRHKVWHLCSLHFEESCLNRTLDVMRLHDNSVPTVFSATEASGEGPNQTRRKKRRRMKTQEELVKVAKMLFVECKPNVGSDRDNTIETTEASGEGPSQIRKKIRSTKTQEELVNAKKLLTEDNPNIAADQDNTFGLYLNQQLQKLSSDQRTFAEKLMSDVLFMARTNQLSATSVIVTTRPSSQATTTITELQISQNSPFSSSPIQYVTSPYIQDKRSPPDTHTSSPIIIIKRPTSQNSAHSSTHFPKPSTSKGGIETQVNDHTPSSQKVLSASSLVQNQDTLQDLPSIQLSSIPKSLDGETKNSAPVQTEQVNTKILKQLLILKKE